MTRRSVHLEDFSHENPVPAACRIGDLLVTGSVHGGGRGSRAEDFPPDLPEQTRVMFARVAALLKAEGGSLDDVAKFSIRIAEASGRQELNDQWRVLFPDPSSRPARQVTVGTTQPHILVQCEVLAVLATNGERDG
ncbi:RidA family protein [Streptomyces olivaceus]|uniref:RidA family protein n=1 Tax=Streptomyces olivaceus TaxID=47716 RepID=UPI001CCB60FD|nr:RidA family protein [Streptomyces olivaceus]MBZ6226332.1 RidA family protein [Streptomyces olivaceus]